MTKRKGKSWLAGYVRKPKPTTVEVTKNEDPDADTDQYGIIYYPIQCPRCASDKVERYAGTKDRRYYKCNACGMRFKVLVVKNDPEPPPPPLENGQ